MSDTDPTTGYTPEQLQQFKKQQESLAMLIGAVRMAQKRGAFTLEEAALIGPAVSVFAPPEQRAPATPPNKKPAAETEE